MKWVGFDPVENILSRCGLDGFLQNERTTQTRITCAWRWSPPHAILTPVALFLRGEAQKPVALPDPAMPVPPRSGGTSYLGLPPCSRLCLPLPVLAPPPPSVLPSPGSDAAPLPSPPLHGPPSPPASPPSPAGVALHGWASTAGHLVPCSQGKKP